jgi:hypothetical protein
LEVICADGLVRNFVAGYWPNPDVGGSALKEMYERVVESEKQRAAQDKEKVLGSNVAMAGKVASNA